MQDKNLSLYQSASHKSYSHVDIWSCTLLTILDVVDRFRIPHCGVTVLTEPDDQNFFSHAIDSIKSTASYISSTLKV